jgi:hypothetical protein
VSSAFTKGILLNTFSSPLPPINFNEIETPWVSGARSPNNTELVSNSEKSLPYSSIKISGGDIETSWVPDVFCSLVNNVGGGAPQKSSYVKMMVKLLFNIHLLQLLMIPRQ